MQPCTYQSLFGQRVRSLRLRMGVSQEELAFQSGLHRTYIGAIERGERNISLDSIVKLARALGVQPADLMPSLEEKNNGL
ncbi:MAG: XRE family transcriptional regulator [Clostridia bacterium]|nr:MAG: XRE family transcriptional regulator [Clostridia bacterium]